MLPKKLSFIKSASIEEISYKLMELRGETNGF